MKSVEKITGNTVLSVHGSCPCHVRYKGQRYEHWPADLGSFYPESNPSLQRESDFLIAVSEVEVIPICDF